MRRLFLGVILLVAAASNSVAEQLAGAAYATGNATSHTVTVSGFYDGDPTDYESVVLKRQSVGICGPDEYLYDYAFPFELEPWDGPGLKFEATVEIEAPDVRVVYRYTAYAIRPDGSEVMIPRPCEDRISYDLVSCSEAPLLRGRLELGGNCTESQCFQFAFCSDDCWTEWVWVDLGLERLLELAGPNGLDLLGQVVDVYGQVLPCQLIGGDSHVLTKIEPAPLGVCGPVPVEGQNWGSVKAMYR